MLSLDRCLFVRLSVYEQNDSKRFHEIWELSRLRTREGFLSWKNRVRRVLKAFEHLLIAGNDTVPI